MNRPVAAVLSLLLATPAVGQTASADWDLHQDEAKATTLAYARFDNGLSVGFRCSGGAMNVVLAGLPESRSERRVLQIGFRGDHQHDTQWTSTTDPHVVVGDLPAPLARDFRQGGALALTVPRGAPDGRNLRYEVELPASSTAIDTVLTACEKPLTDPRDADLDQITSTGLPAGLEWRRQPRPRYPRTNFAAGFAVTTCLTNPDGSLRDCVIEMEHPFDSGFGAAALRGASRASVRTVGQPEAQVETRKMSFLTRFRIP